MSEETLILVDNNDREIGYEAKLKTHIDGLLHRAFSVIIYNSKGEMLIQKRSKEKYHSSNLWANACCGHPRINESNILAAKRRLGEELGFTCDLFKLTEVKYNLLLDNKLYEHEYTHLFTGLYDGELNLDIDEVEEVKWININFLQQDIKSNAGNYAEWFKLYLNKYYQEIVQKLKLLS